MSNLNGYKTYIGIAIAFLGVLGYGEVITQSDADQLINVVTELVGLVIAIYGRWHASKRAS